MKKNKRIQKRIDGYMKDLAADSSQFSPETLIWMIEALVGAAEQLDELHVRISALEQK